MLIERISCYVQEQRWQDIDNILLPLLDNKTQGLEAVLLYVSTLRARNHGNMANEALISASRNRYAVSVQVWGQFAEELMQSGLWPQARDVILKISHADTTTGNFLQLIFFRETENWSEFDKTFKLVYEQTPVMALIQGAWADIRRGRLTQANERLIALTSVQDHPAVLKLRARFNIASGKLADSLYNLEVAKLKMPMDWECLALEGVCKPEQSLSLWEVSLSRQPAQLETLVNLARHYAIQSKWDLANYNCEAALKVKPWSDFPVLLWLNCLAAQQKTDEAWLYLHEKLTQLVTPGRLAAKLDLLRARNVKTKELKQAIDDAIKQFPNDSQLLLSAGAALQQTRQFDRAALCYQKRLNLFPNDISTINNLAQLYVDRGDIELAVETWRSIISVADEVIKLNFAQALLQRGDNFEAEQLFNDVIQRQPSNAIALRGLADIFASAGDYTKAWSFIQNVMKSDPKNSRTWLLAANIQKALEDPKEVEKTLLKGEACSDYPLKLRQALFNYWRGHNQIDKALKYVSSWLSQNSSEVEYPLMLADLEYDRNRFDDAERNLKQTFEVDWLVGGEALVRFYERRERLGTARKLAEQLVRQDPNIMKHHGLLAEVLYRQERYQQALNAIDAGLMIEPYRLSLVRQKMGMLLAQEQYSQAIEVVQSLLNHEESIPNINLMLIAYRRSRQFSQAVDLCRQMLQKYPNHRVLNLWLANSLVNAKCLSQAVDIMRDSYEREPSNVKLAVGYIQYLINFESYQDAHKVAKNIINVAGERPDGILMLVSVMGNMGNHEEVLVLLEQGIAKFPKHLGLTKRRIECLRRLDKIDEEKQAIWALLNDFPAEQILEWGSMRLLDLNAPEEAEKRLTQWQNDEQDSLQPRWAAFNFLNKQKRFGVALQLLDTIERRKPSDPDVFLSRANIYSAQWRMSEAIELTREAQKLRPDSASIVQSLLNLLVKTGDFDEFNELMSRLKHLYGDLRYSQYRNFFFNINCHPTWSPQDIYNFYHDWYHKHILPNKVATPSLNIDKTPHRKLKIGYISPDFRRHAVAYFSEPLLIEHDHDQFELFGFAHLEMGASDLYTDRFKMYFDHWIETALMSSDELEKKIREYKIDIMIDLAGHTSNNSLNIFMRKLAPIQATYLFGSGQTTGLPEIDYIIGSELALPLEHQPFLTEKIAQLPSGFPYCPPHDALAPIPLPMNQNGYITFGVLSRPLRTNRLVFSVWAEILRKLPTAKIRFDHIPYAEPDLQKRIKASFLEYGIQEEQLIFKNTRPHWQVYQEIDIQLDPFPAGSGTTITEGIWMERIAIALRSRPPMGRIAVAQLSALNLETFCCADDEAEYIEKAVALANNKELLRDISSNLRERMLQSRLMNYSAYAKDVAGLYRQMWEEYCQDGEALK